MKKIVVSILVCGLVSAAAIFPAAGTIEKEGNEILRDSTQAEIQTGRDKITIWGPHGRPAPLPLPPWFYALVNNDWNYWSNPPDMYAIPTGNVGIGAINPTSKLEVAGTIHSSAGGFKFPDGTLQTTAATGGGDDDWRWTSGSDVSGDIYHLGDVCIGYTHPSSELEVYGNEDNFVGIRITNVNEGSQSAEGIYFKNEDGTIAGIRLFDEGSATYPSQMNIFNNRPGGSIHLISGSIHTSELYVSGKGTFSGGVDPPYISFSEETHESIRAYAEEVDEHEKVMQFWNGEAHRMEVYVINEDAFYTLTGEPIEE